MQVTVWKQDLAGIGVDLAPKFRVAGVTFDFWETLFMDTPELDRRRDELRCQGLRENLAKLGVEVSIEDLADGFRESTTWLAQHMEEGRAGIDNRTDSLHREPCHKEPANSPHRS